MTKCKPLDDPLVRLGVIVGSVIGAIGVAACTAFYGVWCGVVVTIAYTWGNWSITVGYILGWSARSMTPARNPE